MSSSRIRSNDARPVRRIRLSSIAILVLAVWVVGTFALSAIDPLGVMGSVFSDTFLPVEIALSVIICNRLIYRLNRSVNGMPPTRFSTQHPDTTKTSPVGSATVLVGFQGSVPTGGNLRVVVRMGADVLQLVEVISFRPTYPSYEIPTSEITSARDEGRGAILKLSDGTTIKLANYRGAPLESVLSGAISLPDAAGQYAHSNVNTAVSTSGSVHVTNYAFAFSCFVLTIAAILVSEKQWPYAIGALIGTAGVIGLLWNSRHSFMHARDAAGRRSPAGLRVVVAINLALATLFVFLGYLMRTPIITVGVIAMATLVVGLTLFVVFTVALWGKHQVSAAGPSDPV
jgi:hypothetical protein